MSLSIWRFAHLALAVISSFFLLILSVTGVILAVDAVNENLPDYRAADFSTLTLAETLPALREAYSEIIEVSVHPNGFVAVDATDADGKQVNAYVDPHDGRILGPVKPKSDFIQWNIALHRSLFLKETGRIVMGVVSFLLILIALSGTILIVKRQQGVRHFFAKIQQDFLAQYLHVVTGRLMLILVLIIAVTGSYLFMLRIGMIDSRMEITDPVVEVSPEIEQVAWSDFAVFQQTTLSEVEKIEFPFIPDDAEEPFVIKTKDKILRVNQLDGSVMEETRYPYALVLERLSMDLHTGRTSILWAVILGLASLNIIGFIYTGFVVTFRRMRTKIRNRYDASEATIVLLTGSENGSTLFYANEIHQQLMAEGVKSHLTELNRYRHYPKAEQLVIFTSTHGLGVAPANAVHFAKRVSEVPQKQGVKYCVLGFGSKKYPDFCAYAREVDSLLEEQPWASRLMPLHTVNDRSAAEFTQWIKNWNDRTGLQLTTSPARYSMAVKGLQTMTIESITHLCATNDTFRILLDPGQGIRYQSGDLLAIYPAGDGRERLYSIGDCDGKIQLIVKHFPGGLGSGFLCKLNKGDKVKARVLVNEEFHFPKKAKEVVMICNGTGIAPFLGMIRHNNRQVPSYFYGGFRYHNELVEYYQQTLSVEMEKGNLAACRFAISRGDNPQYVMDLIHQEGAFMAALLENNGAVMICGSLAMQRDVEGVLNQLCNERNGKDLAYYKARRQVLTDCY